MSDAKTVIESGKAVMGLEFGSTRIKAVLIDEEANVIAQGSHTWENRLENGIWTYSMSDITGGLQDCYRDLKEDVKKQYGVTLSKLSAMGISGMMHGYLPFGESQTPLTGFRTWRNTITGEAAAALSEKFHFNVPQRWSIAHLYQAILNQEEHVKDIRFFTTLAGFIHWRLTGEKVMGVGEASGMFPIDDNTKNYDEKMLDTFDSLVADKGFPWKIREILPKVLMAGEAAGTLTEEGAKLLDPDGDLLPGIPLAPPEGDAGTGMVATNSVAKRTGNVSAGTSVFAMVVLERALKEVHEELDMVTTPDGSAVAMVHCNNCTSDLNAWINIFKEFQELFGMETDMDELYGKLYRNALSGDKDCGGLISFNYFAGEPVTGLNEAGRPLFVRKSDAAFNLANFMRSHLYGSLATLKVGCDILFQEEKVEVDKLYGHGGLFKTKGVGQSVLAAAMNAPVAVMKTAGEGGPWGMALLAAYMVNKKDEDLGTYLQETVFGGDGGEVMEPDPADVEGFNRYIADYKKLLKAEADAVEAF